MRDLVVIENLQFPILGKGKELASNLLVAGDNSEVQQALVKTQALEVFLLPVHLHFALVDLATLCLLGTVSSTQSCQLLHCI